MTRHSRTCKFSGVSRNGIDHAGSATHQVRGVEPLKYRLMLVCWFMLRPEDDAPLRDPVDELEGEATDVIVCRRCTLDLAFASDRFPGGRTLHVNPAGYLHEIITVHEARHLVVTGQPTAEATWFVGYTWDIAVCAGCGAHVGWLFEGARSPPRFYGLRTAAIAIS